ncbi:hypothetical protein Tco_0748499 [Tanacetum coccineum]|uniref:Uncharacterized protein n=1 Tax=Tanacetum coccineum TaxID=301880 RepID=A0ABQ4YVV8_9ASTR
MLWLTLGLGQQRNCLAGFAGVRDVLSTTGFKPIDGKTLRKLSKCHKPLDDNTYTENFYVSQTFPNKDLIKDMVTKILVRTRRELYLTRNDKERVRAECRGIVPVFSNSGPNEDRLGDGPSGSQSKASGLDSTKKKTKNGGDIKKKAVVDTLKCPWLLHYVKPKGESSWYCRVFKDTHACLQSKNVRKCTASFLSREIEVTIKPNPKIPLGTLKEQLQKKYEIRVSKQKVFRAKQMAEHKVHGDHITQYTQLRQYV